MRKVTRLVALLSALMAIPGISSAQSAAQSRVEQVANIAVMDFDGITYDGSSDPAGFAWFRNELVFRASDIFGDTELYAYDGRVVRLLADINPAWSDSGPRSSSPSGFTRFRNELLFVADDGTSGRELWSYDGHTVRLVADINPMTTTVCTGRNGGPPCTLTGKSSSPSGLVVFGDELVFAANDGVTGTELWAYDGRSVRRIADIRPGSMGSLSGAWTARILGRELVFTANDGQKGAELWAYDGQDVRLIADINPAGSSSPSVLWVFGNELVFYANDGISGGEPWSYDGHEVRQLADIRTGPAGSILQAPVGRVYRNQLVFVAYGPTGNELWSYDGRQVRQIADINPTGHSTPGGFTEFQGLLVFSASSSQVERELWAYDGTEVRQLADINPLGPSYPTNLNVFGNLLVFAANDGVSGNELWAFDGIDVRPLADINPLPRASSNPAGLMVFGNELIFSANDGMTGTELWRLTHAGGQQ